MTATVHTLDFTERQPCDICESTRAELRRQPLLGFVADMDVCAVCFREINTADDFTKMQLVQEAAYHV